MRKGSRRSKTTYDKIKEVDPQFLENVASMKREELNGKVIEISKYQVELGEAKKNDPDLRRLGEQIKVAGQVYREGLNASKLKLKYLFELLGDKGQ